MTSTIVDASVVLAWLFPDESTPELTALIRGSARQGAWVPAHFHLEVAHSLSRAVRPKRITEAEAQVMLADTADLDLFIDDRTHVEAFETTWSLAKEHGLSVYDAAYLELAMRRGAMLASLDDDLLKAARAVGVKPALD
ncbi:MAG: type II toxin-antitoxin system VapC family toxin [Caulobacterales bacterium]